MHKGYLASSLVHQSNDRMQMSMASNREAESHPKVNSNQPSLCGVEKLYGSRDKILPQSIS